MLAYLDPGTGSILTQVALGAALTTGVLAKTFWHRITSVFRRNNLKEAEDLRS